jgi:hypothetical protein
LPGPIIERKIHQSVTGSKGNCTPEKTLIGEVVGLFLGNPFDPINSSRLLQRGFIKSLQPLITTKQDRKKLDRETTFIQNEDSAGILLNGVNHIYSRIYNNRDRERLLVNDDTMLPDGMDQVIDKGMEYEPETLVPNIDDHIFDDNDKDNDKMVDVNEKIDTIDVVANGEGSLELRPCMMDLVNKGWKKLDKMNVRKVQTVTEEWSQRKQQTMHYIMDRVMTRDGKKLS